MILIESINSILLFFTESYLNKNESKLNSFELHMKILY